MVRILVSIAVCVCLSFQCVGAEKISYPKPSGYVNDFARVIPQEYQTMLCGLIKELKDKTTSEIAVVTIPTTNPVPIEEYAVGLFEKWGIGNKEKGNGLLILVALEDRKIRIETGYGLEGALPDGLCGEIRDRYMLPYFKQGQIDKGIVAGVAVAARIIAKEYQVSLESLSYAPPTADRQPVKRRGHPLQSGLYFLLLLFLLLGRLFLFPFAFLSPRGYWSGGRTGSLGGFGGGFSGGFGGFGGGLSGGGGASGSW